MRAEPLTVHELTLVLRYRPEQVGAACQLLSSAAGRICDKSGCRSCHVGGDLLDPEVVWYAEEWASQESLRRHIQSDDFYRVLVAMDLCSEEPLVTVGELTALKGIEHIRQLRMANPLRRGHENA